MPKDANRTKEKQLQTTSGISLNLVYGPEHSPADLEARLGRPGEPPYTRGPRPNMYRGRLWTMRQYAGFGTAGQSNQRYRHLLAQGSTGLSVAFDLPTQMGYDSDHALASGEVGRVGVAIDSLADMEILLDGIPLDQVSISMTINATAIILLALVVAVAEKQGVDADQLRGTIQNDVLKEYIARGTYIYPPEPSLRIITDIFEHAASHIPKWNTISVSGYHIREAGSTAVQEVAFTLANGLTYVQAAVDRGLDPNVFCRRMSFFFNAHNNFMEEVAKFRAARKLWAELLVERFGVTDPKARMLRFHTQTAGSTLTSQQPDVNVVRVTLQALAAVLGGTQSLHTNGRDEALGLPTKEAATLALRTQQVIAHESGVADIVDPLGGSWALESLTAEVEDGARTYLKELDERGGVLRSIESSYIQNEIHDAAYRAQEAIDSGSQVVVGVNRFQQEEAGDQDFLRLDPSLEKNQTDGLKALRAERDQVAVDAALAAIAEAARGNENLFPHVLEAVRRYATLGEISDSLREVFGTYQQNG